MRSLVIVTLVISWGATCVLAGPDNIGHERHKHHHNEKHPRVIDENRFHTNRDGAQLFLPSEEEGFVFGIFGDRTGGPATGVSILADAVHDINLFEPDLVMTVGDMVQGYNAKPQWMEQMREYKGIMDELLCPWFPVPGNHDIHWRGPNAPRGQHEQNYEMHFGPLWYAFEHKNSWFIALYSDEGNPATGRKSSRDPADQQMSENQFEWLRSILEKAKDADHVFLFLHHPRWLGGSYGRSWRRVHRLLVEAGNVTAVFAGHIHRMRSDPRDGIEYFTLATVGGGQAGHAPEAGWLHHYNLVAVRKGRIAIATVPVGKVLDPREITGDVNRDSELVARQPIAMPQPVRFAPDRSVDEVVTLVFANPTDDQVEVTFTPKSGDSRWVFSPDHVHLVAQPNETIEAEIGIRRRTGEIDETFRRPMVTIDMDYINGGFRYSIPSRTRALDLDLASMNLKPGAQNLVLDLDGDGDVLRVPSRSIPLPDGPMTLEAWFEADRFEGRTALMTKMQSCEYGFFVTDGRPSFVIHLNGEYVEAQGRKGALETGRLYHMAGVFDGEEVRLYVDGALVQSRPGAGKRTMSELDLMIGGDVDGDNRPVSTLDGRIHSFRLSKSARYTGDSFSPSEALPIDEETIFATHMDTRLLDWVINEADASTYGRLVGDAALIAR